MTKFIQRMRGLQLRLLRTQGGARACPDSDFDVDAIRDFRAKAYSECNSLPKAQRLSEDEADEQGWHLVAKRDAELVGCIRFLLYRPDEADEVPIRVTANSRCAFSEQDRERCTEAIAQYVSAWRKLGGPLVQAGGLAVARQARHSVVGPALCLAGNAFIRSMGGSGGIVFAAEKTRGAQMYAKAGCVPLRIGNTPLGLLEDSFHQDRVLVMSIEPRAVAAELEATVCQLGRLLPNDLSRLETSHV